VVGGSLESVTFHSPFRILKSKAQHEKCKSIRAGFQRVKNRFYNTAFSHCDPTLLVSIVFVFVESWKTFWRFDKSKVFLEK